MSYEWQNWETLVQSKTSEPIRHMGSRLDECGVFLPEHGNTIVRHALPNTLTYDALQSLRSAMMALPYADHFAFTAATSLHMTVFEGVIEHRREDKLWPSDLPKDMDIDEATKAMDERLADYVGPGTFNMRALGLTPLGFALTGVTDEDNVISRKWRNTLVGPMGYRSPAHDTYTFHMSFAYVVKWMSDEATALYRRELQNLLEKFQTEVPVLELGPPMFCTFKDMNAFPPIRPLEGFK